MKSLSLKGFLRQTINKQAFFAISKSLGRPSLCIPRLQISSLDQLNLSLLKECGIRGIIFDKDNTLTITYMDELHPSVVQTVQECKKQFPSGLAILSNSIGSSDDIDYKEAHAIQKALDIPVIRHMKKKPDCLFEVMEHFQAQVDSSDIRDRVLTDVVFGNLHGMFTVLVAPLSHTRDHPVASILRLLETKVLLPLLRLLIRSIPTRSRLKSHA
eukprot:gene12728-26812_t